MKRQREKRLAELEKQLKVAEEEHCKIRDQLLKTELLLTENKKLFSTAYGSITTDQEDQTISTPEEAFKTPIPLRPRISNSLPRFMTSTAASRQRQGASEKEFVSKAQSQRSVSRSSVLLVSQSLSYSGPLMMNQNRKTRFSAVKHLPIPAMDNYLDLKAPSLARSKVVTSSDPNLKAALGRHKRRNSSLI